MRLIKRVKQMKRKGLLKESWNKIYECEYE